MAIWNNENVDNHKSFASWSTISICFLFFWPIGIYLLVKKIRADRETELVKSKIIRRFGVWLLTFGGIWVFHIITSIVTEGRVNPQGLAAAAFFITGGVLILNKSKQMALVGEIYREYISVVVNDGITSIDSIASAMYCSYELALEDLQRMIDKGYFKNAYIDRASRQIVLRHEPGSPEPAAAREENRYRQRVAVACKSCGAQALLDQGEAARCKYCGSHIP